MPLRIKVYLGLFTTVAVFIVTGVVLDSRNLTGLEARVAGVLGLNPETGEPINDPAKPSTDPFAGDIDKDGIKDELESLYDTNPTNPDTDGDGFLDGEEVITGCDPLEGNKEKDCPESYNRYLQRLEQNDRNITDEVNALIAQAVQAQDLMYGNPNFYANLQSLQAKVTDDTTKLFVIESSEHPIIISDDNSPTAINIYLQHITNLAQQITSLQGRQNLEPLLQTLLENPDEETETGNLFHKSTIQSYLANTKLMYAEAIRLSVPSSWVDIHRDILNYIKKNEVIFGSLLREDDDPLRAVSATATLVSLYPEYKSLIIRAINKINEQIIPMSRTTINWFLETVARLGIQPDELQRR